MKKLGRVLLVIAVFAVFLVFQKLGLSSSLTLDSMKANLTNLQEYTTSHPMGSAAIYLLSYVVMAAFSLPGAAVFTLLAGAVFGLWKGLVLVSFASTVGATLAFLGSRFLFRDWVEKKFRGTSETVNRGLQKEGALYLLTLRLVPAFPFFIVNLVMGLTRIPTGVFYLVSQIGMLPGTFVFVNAGRELGRINSVAELLSPKIIGAFSLLGIFPLVMKKVLALLKARKVYRRFKKPRRFEYNLVAIGAGAAGLVTCYIGAALKAKIALIEKNKMGGDCLNTGCVPSKALIRTAKVFADAQRAQELGLRSAKIDFNFAEVMERIQKVISKVEPHDSVERYTKLGVDCIQGTAKILSPWEIEVGGRRLTTKNIVLATGASPAIPPIRGLEKIKYWTTDTLWEMREQPKRLLILGGGAIGAEIAQCFARLGTKVTLIERNPTILSKEDEDVSEIIAEQFRQEGIEILTATTVREFMTDVHRIAVCESHEQTKNISFDDVLLALGRRASTRGFGLEELGVELTPQGTFAVDEYLRTKYPNIYACGDCVGPYQFTHMAGHQAWHAAVNALISPLKKFKVDYSVVPWATYTDPEVARVGLSEQEAREKGIAHEVTRYGIDDLDRAIADEEDHGFVKILTKPGSDKILGVTIVSSHASDMIAEYVAAMKHGFGLNKILGTIHVYPTFSEANKLAAGVWKREHAPQSALKFLEKFHTWRRS